MSTTAGNLPWSAGRETSPTRLTPSLAGNVTSAGFTLASAGAAASRAAAVRASTSRIGRIPDQRDPGGFPDIASGSRPRMGLVESVQSVLWARRRQPDDVVYGAALGHERFSPDELL